MKRNLLYLFILLVLSFLTYYFVFREKSELYDTSEANFNVKDTGRITSIFLTDLLGDNVKISRKDQGWVLNDSLAVRKDAVDFMLEALALQKAEQPVPTGYHDAAIRELSANSTKVEIYHEKEKTHTFYVARNAGYNNVTYMLTEGAKRPYIVKIPMRNMFLGVRYFTRLNDWRDRKILYSNNAIESVEVNYKDSTQYSFTLSMVNGNPVMKGSSVIDKPLNLKRVNTYLKILNEVYCTGFEERYLEKDSIINNGRQMATVTIKRANCNPQQLIVFFKPPDKGTKGIFKVGGIEYDFDSFFGLLNQKDFLILSRKNAEKMLRSFPEFYEADQ